MAAHGASRRQSVTEQLPISRGASRPAPRVPALPHSADPSKAWGPVAPLRTKANSLNGVRSRPPTHVAVLAKSLAPPKMCGEDMPILVGLRIGQSDLKARSILRRETHNHG